jgi:hypothetical protein
MDKSGPVCCFFPIGVKPAKSIQQFTALLNSCPPVLLSSRSSLHERLLPLIDLRDESQRCNR